MTRLFTYTCALLVLLVLPGCASLQGSPLSLIEVQSADIPGTDSEEAFQSLSRAFLNRGYDIKSSDREAGYVTTEYKKYASYRVGKNDGTPFDFSLQIRAIVQDTPQGLVIQLRPTMKQQNRNNAAAYSEVELGYYRMEDNTALSGDNQPWREEGLTEFMNVVSDLCQSLNVSQEDVTMNETRKQYRYILGQIIEA